MVRRHTELFKILIRENKYRPASFFSKELLVSTKTVYSDLSDLEEISKQFDLEILKLRRNGILLSGIIEEKYKMLDYLNTISQADEFSIEYRRNMIFKNLVFGDKAITIDSYSNEFHVSRTSIQNDVGYIQNYFKEFNVSVVTKGQGLELEGNEHAIQSAIKYYIENENECKEDVENSEVNKHFFDKQLVNCLSRMLLEDLVELTTTVSQYYLSSLQLTMLIQIQRLRLGYHVEKEDQLLLNNMKYMETFIVANTVVEELKKQCGVDFHFDDVEYLSKQLFAHRITNNIRSSNTEHQQIVLSFLQRLNEMKKVDLLGDQKLIQSLLYHFPAMLVRLQRDIKISNPLLVNIKHQYSELFSVVWYALSFIESRYNLRLNDDEVSLILIHIQIALDKVINPSNIIVVCPYGSSSSQLIVNRLKRILPANDNVEISSLENLRSADLKNIDLIISSIDIDVKDVPVVKISSLINNTDYINIMNAYSVFVLDKEDKLNHKGNKLNFGNAISLDPHLIELNLAFNTKEECLDYMISKLEKQSYVNEKYRESVLNREKMGTTSLQSGVALPHASPETVKQSSISIVSLKHPIKWGTINVRLVIMVSYSESDSIYFSDAITQIYKLIESNQKVENIVSLNSISEVIRLFTD